LNLIVRLERQYRDNPEEIGNILVATPAGQQIPLKEFADIPGGRTAPRSFIDRTIRATSGVQFSVEGRDLAGAVEIHAARSKIRLRCRRATVWIGRRIHGIYGFAPATECHFYR